MQHDRATSPTTWRSPSQESSGRTSRRWPQRSAAGIRPFYDDYEKAALWGKDLYEHLDWVYQKAARYCVLFASEAYARKVWTSHERKSAQARALQSGGEYVLPVRFDDTEIPGLRPRVAYVEASDNTPAQLAKLISEKLGPRVREKFFPPFPDNLFEALGAKTVEECQAVERIAHWFMQMLIRMTVEERGWLPTSSQRDAGAICPTTFTSAWSSCAVTSASHRPS